MGISVQGQVGPQRLGDGSNSNLRLGRDAELIASELHGRFYEQASRGNLFSIGSALTALSANTIALTATATPILGIWNPPGSNINVVLLQAGLGVYLNSTSPTPPGVFVWAASVGNSVITTGSAPFNRRSLIASGSQVKAFTGGVALTGLTNNLTVIEAADFANPSSTTNTTIAAATPTPGVVGTEYFDGSIIIPPGAVLALLNTVSTTTHSVAGRILWEEVPLA